MELDHIFICTPSLATDASRLADFGLQPGRSRVHAGQGTQNVCFFFDNAYLELLGLHDEAEARSPVVAPLGLWERVHWQQTGACPFGVCLRLVSGSLEAVSAETWGYAAPFLPLDVTLPIFTPPNAVDLPLVFLSPAAVLPARSPASADLPLGHLGDRRTLTQIILQLPVTTARLKTLSLLG
ncbi:VOC family protein [Thermoleptolyngbya sp.]